MRLKYNTYFLEFHGFTINLYSFFLLLCPAIAYNVPAAWRSGGFHCTCCGVITFKFALNCPRGTAAIAPNRPLAAGVCYIAFFFFSNGNNSEVSEIIRKLFGKNFRINNYLKTYFADFVSPCLIRISLFSKSLKSFLAVLSVTLYRSAYSELVISPFVLK